MTQVGLFPSSLAFLATITLSDVLLAQPLCLEQGSWWPVPSREQEGTPAMGTEGLVSA